MKYINTSRKSANVCLHCKLLKIKTNALVDRANTFRNENNTFLSQI